MLDALVMAGLGETTSTVRTGEQVVVGGVVVEGQSVKVSESETAPVKNTALLEPMLLA
jgi:hypothetical protein